MTVHPPHARHWARSGLRVLGASVAVTALTAFGAVQGGSAAHAAATPSATAAATTPALAASATTVVVGTPVTFTYSAPSNLLSTSNWIGWYSAGHTPGVQASTLWDYTQTGTQSYPPSGSSPVASGQVTFSTAGLAVGTYTVYFLYNDGYTIIGSPVTIQVTSAPVAPGTLTAAKTSATAGDQVSFDYTMPSGDVNSGNKVAWFPAGANPVSSVPLYAFKAAASAASGTATFDTSGLAD